MPEIQTIPSWSFSALDKYTTCPYQVKLARIDKIPEIPRGAPPPGMTEWANDRGNRVHDNAEQYVRGEIDEPCKELNNFYPEIYRLRELYPQDMVLMEDMWCFDRDWAYVDPDDYDNIWLRVKLDVAVFITNTHAIVIDYKTGKRYGNELKHAQQGQLYQLAMFMRFPELEYVDVEFWYLDHDEIAYQGYRRKAGMMFYKNFNNRAVKMTSDTEFDANPNNWNCKFCPYGPEESSNKWVTKNGACSYGV